MIIYNFTNYINVYNIYKRRYDLKMYFTLDIIF